MTSATEKSSRANIRIEISNDIADEPMDIDTSELILEDGEISDGKENDDRIEAIATLSQKRTITLNTKNENDRMSDQEDEEKRQTRAKRFGLEVEMLSDTEISELHESLGITDEERVDVRFDALHMYGTQDMSTQDVYAYFGKYTPNSVEWINDESCNVVWLDKSTAARALNNLSRVIAGMPVRGSCDPFQNDFEVKSAAKHKNGTSILLMDDTSKREASIVSVADLNIPIPPGYWRLGEPSPKAAHILLRYAKRTDKKPFRAEKFSEYYRKHGNPNYGGIRGIISESKKQESKTNPWGRLAQNWNKGPLERADEEAPFKPKTSKALLNRLGTAKRSFSASESEEEEEPAKKSKVPRMRMYADEEEARVTKMKELKKIRALEKIEESITQQVPDLRNRLRGHKSELRKPLITSRLQLGPTLVSASASTTTTTPIPIHKYIKEEIKVTARNDFRQEEPSESESSDDDLNVQQRSKVTVIVKKPNKPTVASTIWSRLADDKNKQNINSSISTSTSTSTIKTSSNKSSNEVIESNSSSRSRSRSRSRSSSSNSSNTNSESETETSNKTLLSINNPRPGFRKDLKSRLGLVNSEHKSPLRIEINNDHYSNNK